MRWNELRISKLIKKTFSCNQSDTRDKTHDSENSCNQERRTILKTVGGGLCAASLGSISAFAGTNSDYPIVLEDAESQDLSRYSGEFNWTADKGGDGYWGTTTDTDDPNGAVLSGNASMKGYEAAHGGYHTIVTLDQTVQQGDSLRAKVYHPHKHTYTGLLFGVQSTDHPYPCYRLRIDNGGSPTVALEKIPPGGPIESHNLPDDCILAYTDCEPVENTVYTVEWDWNTDGTIPFTVYNPDGSILIEESNPASDAEFTSGGFGFMVSKSNPNADDMTSIVDEYVITSSDSTSDSNSAPTASDDSASVIRGQSVTIDVLANDSDTDGSLNSSSVTVVNAPSNGTATVNSDGTIDYTHDGGDTSSDSFKYTVDDDDGATSNEGTVSITVEQSSQLDDGLIGHWQFEETSGAVVDSSSNGLDGTNNGASRGVTGLNGSNAIELDGSSYVDLPDDSLLPSGNDPYTLSAWFRTAQDQEGGLIGWGDYDNCSKSTALRVTSLGAGDEVSFKHFWWCDDLTVDTTVKYGDVWHHVVASHDGSSREIWLDGERVASDAPSSHEARIANAAIGLTHEEYFQGRIDEVRVYDRSLADSEIQTLWEQFEGSDTTAPTAPSNLSASNMTTSSVDLSWDASSDSGTGVDYYTIYRDGTAVKEVSTGTTTATVSSLSAATTYDFYVTAVDGAGNESDPSNTVTVTTDEETKTVTVTGDGVASYNSGTTVRYIIETSGTIESAGTGDLESTDREGGSEAAGRVPADGSDTDTYSLVGGKVTDVSTWGGDVTITVDGSTWSS